MVHHVVAGVVPQIAAKAQNNQQPFALDYELMCAGAYGYLGAMSVPMVIYAARKIGVSL
jgi:hypothetical protein